MKEFQALRTELNEQVTDLAEHIAIANSSMPPNILILRRKTVRQFPNNTMVALYYNDKLGQYFSIPYGGDAPGVVTPVALKEAMDIGTIAFHTAKVMKDLADSKKRDEIQALIDKPARTQAQQKEYQAKKDLKAFRARQNRAPGKSVPLKEEAVEESTKQQRADWMSKFQMHVVKAKPEHAGKIDWDTAHYFHNSGHTPEAAATLYHTRRRDLKKGEQIQELSKGMLGSYIRGAARNKDLLMVKSGNMRMVGNDKEAEKYQEKSFKRTKGIRTAAEKLVNKGPRSLEEGAISHLERVKAFKTSEPLRHADGTKTKIDPTTANALLTVHAALKPEHQVKFVQHLEHSKPKFNRMLNFAWSQVK